MRNSGIGGQAVIEGIMMRNQDKYSVGVRRPDREIEIKIEDYKSFIKNEKLTKIPFVRGVFNFIDSMVVGMKTLTYSASFYEEEEEAKPRNEKQEKLMMGMTVAFSIVMAVVIFMLLPYFMASFLRRFTESSLLLAVLEGVLRMAIFIGYILLISRMEDIQRVFQYHGAEHKCINCIEHEMELTVENVRKSSRQHKRCGTSFLLIVMVVSIIFFLFIRVESPLWRVVVRLLLVPVIAGVSYEFIRLAGRSEHPMVAALSKPGLWLQKLTTREPDDSMIEVAIAAVEAVFDWKKFLSGAEASACRIMAEEQEAEAACAEV